MTELFMFKKFLLIFKAKMKSLLMYTIIIILFIMFFKIWSQTTGPESDAYNKGYGSKQESVATLLTRIEWSNHCKGRVNLLPRHYIYSVIIVLFVLIAVLNRIPTGLELARGIFVSFLFLMALTNYNNHHGDKFPHYAIDSNVQLLRKKLKLRKTPISRVKKVWSSTSQCWNFFFKDI